MPRSFFGILDRAQLRPMSLLKAMNPPPESPPLEPPVQQAVRLVQISVLNKVPPGNGVEAQVRPALSV
jgi:hypothetical protein